MQSEETVSCGRALYSTNQIKKEALIAEISKTISRRVVARWRTIYTGVRIKHNEGKSTKLDEVHTLQHLLCINCDPKPATDIQIHG